MTNNFQGFRFSYFLILTSLFFLSCSHNESQNRKLVVSNPEYGSWQDLEIPPFEFELIDTFDFESFDELVIGDISFLISDSENNLYFLDSSQNKLISIDSDGNLRWETGQPGRGPGDFQFPLGLVTDGEFLYLSNIMATRLDKYDMQGNFIQSYDFGPELYMGIPIGLTNNDQVVIRTRLDGKIGSTINLVELSADSLNTIAVQEYDQTNGLELFERANEGANISVHNNSIIEGNLFEYAFTFYDLDQDTIKTVSRNFDDIVRPGIASFNGREQVSTFSLVDPPRFLNDGYYLVRAEWPANVENPDQVVEDGLRGNEKEVTYRNSIDLFNSDDELLYSFESDGKQSEFGELLHTNGNGFIYFLTNDPAPAIQKYQLFLN
jgi:hypothetical protein